MHTDFFTTWRRRGPGLRVAHALPDPLPDGGPRRRVGQLTGQLTGLLGKVPQYGLLYILLAALAVLTGCASLPPDRAAPIRDARVHPVDPADEQPLAPCLPVPAVLVPASAAVASPPPHRVPHRPIRRPHPVKQPEPAPTVPSVPPEAPKPAPIVDIHDLGSGQVRGLLDARVQRGNGNVVGRAVDAVVNAQSRPRQIVVNLIGFMGVGDRKVSLPWHAVRFDPAAAAGTAPITLASDAIETRTAGATPAGSPATGGAQINVIDATVYGAKQEQLGRIVDVLIDREGHPRAAVLDISDSVIHDKRLIAVEWSVLKLNGGAAAPRLEAELDSKQIAAAPLYEPGKPPRIIAPMPSRGDASDPGKR